MQAEVAVELQEVGDFRGYRGDAPLEGKGRRDHMPATAEDDQSDEAEKESAGLEDQLVYADVAMELQEVGGSRGYRGEVPLQGKGMQAHKKNAADVEGKAAWWP